jgi:hypothetical protein
MAQAQHVADLVVQDAADAPVAARAQLRAKRLPSSEKATSLLTGGATGQVSERKIGRAGESIAGVKPASGDVAGLVR